jgi:hypothetical protein
MASESKWFGSWDRRTCFYYLLCLSGAFLVYLALVWARHFVEAVREGPVVWALLWFGFLGLVLGYQFLLVGNVVKSTLRIQSEEKLAATSLLLEYLNCTVGEAPEWVQWRHKHPAFSQSTFAPFEWSSVGEAVCHDLDRYDPNKNVFLGLVLFADDMLSELPLASRTGWTDTVGSCRVSRMKQLDSLITSHLPDDVRRLYPREVYHLRVNFLRDYMRREDGQLYENREDEKKPWDKRWFWLYGYDLPEELPVLRFCRHCLGHLNGNSPAPLDEQGLRERFQEVHEEYFPNNMQRVGGSWLRPREGGPVVHPCFTFRSLTETEEAVLERIANSAHVGLMTGHTTVDLGGTDEEAERALNAIWKLCGYSPQEPPTFHTEMTSGQDVPGRSRHAVIETDVVHHWDEYKETKRRISCPECHKPGLRKKSEDRVVCPHCGHEFPPEGCSL